MMPLARTILATLVAFAGAAAAAPPPAPKPPATPSPAAGAPTPRPPARNIAGPGDYALREAIAGYLGRDPDLRQETRYNLILVNGGAVLSGEFTNCARKMKVLKVAAATRGIVNVTDEAGVARNGLPDAELEKAVRQALEGAAGEIGLKNAEVEVQDGVATLRGTVKDYPSRVRGEEVAGSVLGVTRIVNRLLPANVPSAADDVALQKVAVAYLSDWRQFGQAADLKVLADHGVVTLSGRVALYLARQQAAVLASLIGGVTRVENRIKVDPSLPPAGLARPQTMIRERRP